MSQRVEVRIGKFDDVLNIDIEYKSWDSRSTSVMVSRNGYQWSGFALDGKDEVVGLRDALNRYIWSEGWE